MPAHLNERNHELKCTGIERFNFTTSVARVKRFCAIINPGTASREDFL